MGGFMKEGVKIIINFLIRFLSKLPFTPEIYKIYSNVDGQISLSEANFLFQKAKRLRVDGVIVEIGSYRGKSTICLAKGSMKNNKRRIVYAIDPHKDFKGIFGGKYSTKDKEIFLENLKKYNVADTVKYIQKTSHEASKNFNNKIALLFIDGDHRYESVKQDINDWLPFVVTGGIVMLHDVKKGSGPKRVLDLLKREGVIDDYKVKKTIGYFIKQKSL